MPAATAAVLLLLATFSHAQDSQFHFDANGNLLAQTARPCAPPEILAHPQSRVVVPGETASSFLVEAHTRTHASTTATDLPTRILSKLPNLPLWNPN